jgi:putative membrane protein insertion efficiency factor
MKRLIKISIRGYQLIISPMIGQRCRFQPTCSHYTLEAVEEFGAIKGSYLGIKRILRCHPWGSEGYDPVPSTRAQKVAINQSETNHESD